MESGLAIAGFNGLKTAAVGSVCWHSHGASRQAVGSSSPWLSWKQGLNVKGTSLDRSWQDASSISNRRQKRSTINAEMTASASTTPLAPLIPESPSGQFLTELLQSHPHLVPAAAEQQLETLAEAREAASSQEQPITEGNELVLYKRIAELRAQERRRSLEDIMYALISQKFFEAGISLVPQMSSCPKNQRVDTWNDQDKELEEVHSAEAFELIQEHLALVLGGKGGSYSIDQNAMAQISKLRMGRVYAASAVYGYFLRRVDKRFQLEKTVDALPPGLVDVEQTHYSNADADADLEDEVLTDTVSAVTALVLRSETTEDVIKTRPAPKTRKSGRLRAYVMSLDADTLQRYATVRSKESVSVIERHTEALFGKPEIQVTQEGNSAIVKDEAILLGFSGLRRLVLEAVAFGSFLWDVETYVDTHYHIVGHQ